MKCGTKKKWIRRGIGILSIILLLTLVDMTTTGWLAVIGISIALAAIRIYRQWDSVKATFQQASMLGELHKNMKHMEKLEPKNIQEVEKNESSTIRKSI